MSTAKAYDVHCVGRRKTSIARVYMKAQGAGKIKINKRDFNDYFPKATDRYVAAHPLNHLKITGQHDFYINVKGGGTTGQAGAIKLGIARAMIALNPQLRGDLKKMGFLTRDSRKVERKKAGLRGARRRFQFSKR